MPLKLVTGPANAAKAGEVLGGLRARLAEEPVLLVPAYQDVEHAQRELAERGAVFGAQVVRFDWFFELIALRVGYSARKASDLQLELIVEDAVRGAGLRLLSASAERPGFIRAAGAFMGELGRSMVEPQRLTKALRDWAGDGPRRRYADEVAAIYSRYRQGLERAGLVDGEEFAWRALDALRLDPAAWGRTPVFAYGFDDFTPLELDALETLAGRVGVDVLVSLPHEPGREAFKAVDRAHARLAEVATEQVDLPPAAEWYAEGSRHALHHLERELFSTAPAGPVEPGEAVRLHSAGGARAEVELVAAEVLGLLRDGTAPGEVAVVFRDPAAYASLVEQVFGAYGIPFSLDHRVDLGHTGLGRGLLALLRCAIAADATADDLLAWLRTPGRLDVPGLADQLEAEVRRQGVEALDEARAIWDGADRPALVELDRLTRARGDVVALLKELESALGRLFGGPYRRSAPLLAGAELDDARVLGGATAALREMRALAEAGLRVELGRISATLSELKVRTGEREQPDRVQVTTPEAVRARRFQAVFVCGLQEGEFPRHSRPEPFLPDDERMEIATAGGLALQLREDQLDRERYLFYVCASRAERLLVLSARYCDEEGGPEAESFFLEDVRELFTGLPVRERTLSQVTWPPESAPTPAEWERARALAERRVGPRLPGPLQHAPVLAALAERTSFSASALEAYADCPVKWLVDRVLRPEALEPDPEAMVRGRYAHSVLHQTYARLRELTSDRRVTPANLVQAERLLLEAMEEQRPHHQISLRQTRARAAARRLEFELLRFLRHEAAIDTRFEPEHLELEFGDGDTAVALELGIDVRGRIDRVDVWDGYALVRDYKTGRSVDRYRVAKWRDERILQAPLYMLALQHLLPDKQAAGGIYTPLGGDSRTSRGLVASELKNELGSGYNRNDWQPEAEFQEHLSAAREEVLRVVAGMKEGRLEACPDTCAWRGGCSHPSICRVEE